MAQTILGILIGAPIVCGTAAWIVRSSKARAALAILTAVIVAAAGLTLTGLSLKSAEAVNGVLTVSGGHLWEPIGFAVEMAVILVILAVAIRIKSLWIAVFAVAQAALSVAIFAVAGKEEPEMMLFRIDNLSRIMLLVTCVVGPAIVLFSIGYMREHEKHAPPTAASLGQFYFFFLSFLGCMAGLVVSENLTFFSIFWEATTFCSYALIGQDGGEARSVNAKRALFINSFGGVLLLIGVLLLKLQVGGETFRALLTNGSATLLAASCLCIAAFTKSALFPFQSWLLGAMVAPTPVSAMLHAATMVKAGVYLVMRITPGFYGEKAMLVVAFMGALTFVAGALLACTQSNGKKVLAYSTISNLGLVVACAGINTPLAYAAGLSIISFHAISKGLLFLCVGRIEQVIGSRDIEAMDGMYFKMPFTTSAAWIGMVSMLLPPFGMLQSKWLAIEATILSPVLLLFIVAGSAFTVFFWTKWIGRMQNTGYHSNVPPEQIPFSMRFSLGFLAALVLTTGAVIMLIYRRVFDPMARAVYAPYDLDWKIFNQAGESQLVSLVIYLAMVLGAICYLIIKRNFRPAQVHLPYLCGENILASELVKEGVHSYDFHSKEDQVVTARLSNIYFRNVIDEDRTTQLVRWCAWLIIFVLIGMVLQR